MPVRIPCAAGTFYPDKPSLLVAELRRCLGGEVKVPDSPLPGSVGLLLPHAGYRYSGEVAGTGFRELALLGRPELAVIMGSNHTGLGGAVSVAPPGEWVTPLGPLPVPEQLSRRLAEALEAEQSELPFLEEHSVEVQLPFLRYLFGEIPILPLVVQWAGPEALRSWGEKLAAALGDRPLVVIASSDFSHYEPDAVAREKDRRALARILNLDLEGFLSEVQRHRISICGVGAIGILLSWARTRGLFGAQLLSYRTSGEVVGLLDQVVGYAAVMFREVEEVA